MDAANAQLNARSEVAECDYATAKKLAADALPTKTAKPKNAKDIKRYKAHDFRTRRGLSVQQSVQCSFDALDELIVCFYVAGRP